MRGRIALAVVCLMVGAATLVAQERIQAPPPDPAPYNGANIQPPPPPSGPPQPYGPPPGPGAPPLSPWANSPYPAPIPTLPSPPPPLPPPPQSPYGPVPYPAPFTTIDPHANPLFWVDLEGLVWWSKNQPLSIPLVTTGPASLGPIAGNIGAPATTSLNGRFDYDAQPGFRLLTGLWFDCEHTFGMEAGFFVLGQQTAHFGVTDPTGTGGFVINEPVIGAPFITQVSGPGVGTGTVLVDGNDDLAGGEFSLMCNLVRSNGWTVNLLGGYRYIQLNENLNISATSTVFSTTTYTDNFGNVLATAPPGSVIGVVDQFGTKNEFNSGQIGMEFQYLWDRWIFAGMAKLALGDMHEVVDVNGFTNVFPVSGNPVMLTGGNYATLQIGRYSIDRFAVAPELQLKAGYTFNPWISALVGYDFLYLSSVARPGNQIDNTFDGITHPGVPLASSTFWSQGLTVSLQFNF